MKNLIGIALFIFCSTFSFSQDEDLQLSKTVEYGISIGGSYSSYLVKNPSNTLDEVYGFNLGILSKINFSDKLLLIPQGVIHFRENNISFTDINGNEIENSGLNELSLEVPLHLSYHPLSKTTANPGLIFGPRYRYNIAEKEDQLLNLNNHQVSIDVGVSMDFVFSQFTIRPTLSYSRGVSNMLPSDIRLNSDSNLKMHTYGITLQFFG